MIKKILLLSTIALSLSFSHFASAKMHEKDNDTCKCMKKEQMKEMKERLNLTDEQQKQMKVIKEDAKTNLKANYEKMVTIKKDMKNLVVSDSIDEMKLDQLIEQKKELVGQKTKIMLQTKNKIYNLLNAEQKAKYSAMMDKWHEKSMERMKKMHDSANGMDDDEDDEDDD